MSNNTILATAPLTTTGFHIKATGTTLGNSLIWDNGTNVGIGNTNTSYTLDVTGTGRFTGALTGTSATFNGTLQVTTTSNNGITITTNDITTLRMNTSSGTTKNWGFATTNLAASDFGIYQSTSNGGDPILAGTAKLYFSGTGNVGIGTSSPNGALHIVAGVNTRYGIYDAPTSGYCFQEYKFNGTTYGYTGQGASLVTGGSNTDMGIVSINNLVFGAGSSPNERMRITSGGTIQAQQSMQFGLSYSATQYIEISENQIRRIGNGVLYINNSNTGDVLINQYGGATYANGTNGFGRVVTVSSDERIKKSVETIDNALDKVLQMNGVYYEFNAENELKINVPNGKRIGLIAQQIENILPEAVLSPLEDNQPKSIDYSGMIGLLINAIKEQNQTIQSLQEQINILAK